MKVTEKKFLNVHQTLSPLLPNGIAAAVSAKDLEAAKAAAVATAADKVMVSVGTRKFSNIRASQSGNLISPHYGSGP